MAISIYTGDETFLLNQAVHSLRAQVVNPAMASLSHRVLNNPDIGELIEALGTVTFNLAGTTLYEIINFPFLAKAASDPADEKQLEELKTILESLNTPGVESGKFVLFVNDKINRTIKFTKWLCKLPGVDTQEFKQLAFWEGDKAVQLLMDTARKRKISLMPQAASALVENMGVSLQPLFNELDKLSVYTAGKPVTLDDVKLMSNHNDNTFAMLADWVNQRNQAQRFVILNELLLRQQPVQLFALIQTYLNNLFQLRLWQQLGLSQAQMAERTKKHPFKIKKDLEEFGRVPFERLAQLKEKALQREHQSKTGEIQAHLALELLLAS